MLTLAAAGSIFAEDASGPASAQWRFVDQKGTPVEDVVVALIALETSQPAPSNAPTGPAEITQRDQAFVPYVTVVATGGSVAFPNRDTVEHHVYSLSKARRFEIPLYGQGETEVLVFDQPGVITLGCNIHDWMVGYIVVVDTPYHGRSEADGRARIAGVPAGRYRVDIWHPRLAPKEFSLEVTLPLDGAAIPAPVSLRLKPDRRPVGPIRRGGYR